MVHNYFVIHFLLFKRLNIYFFLYEEFKNFANVVDDDSNARSYISSYNNYNSQR